MSSLREVIMHAARSQAYDPQARRERYLRERKLLGRKTGGDNRPDPGDWSSRDGPKKPPPPKEHPKSTPVTPERVAALKVRLAQLKEILSKLVEQARVEAGAEPTTKTDDKKAAKEEKKPDKKTAAEKREEAKKAKETRDKEPPKPETASSVQAQIESVRKQIEDMRAKLAAARKAAPTKKPPPDRKFEAEDDKKQTGKQPTATEGRHH